MIFIDSSVAASILLKEEKSKHVIEYLKKGQIISSVLFESEIKSVLAREKIPLSESEPLLDKLRVCYPNRSLRAELDLVFDKSYCRGADAFHVACALYFDPTKENIKFFTLDQNQKKAAQAVGFKVVTL